MRAWDVEFDSLEATRKEASNNEKDYFIANRDKVKRTLLGAAAYTGGTPRPGLSAVVNLPAVRAVLFLLRRDASRGHGVYENRYTYAARVGQALKLNSVRAEIDQALADIAANEDLTKTSGLTATNGHYAAMDLNGPGVRYYGDICLVLKENALPTDTLILERNSFEVRVPPTAGRPGTVKEKLKKWAGQWRAHGVFMAAMRVMAGRPLGLRLMTTGTVSNGLIEDEDYLEIVIHKRFYPKNVAEVRVTAEDAAAEALIGDRARVGLAPTGAEALWRYRRRVAARLARRPVRNLPLRVVTTTGRAR